MFRVIESHRVNFYIDGHERDAFLRELLAVPIERGELALVRVRTARQIPTRGAVLLVHGFGMNRHTCHLGRRSFAGFLAQRGYDTFVLELRGVGRSRQLGSRVARHPEEYVLHDLPAALDAVRLRSGHERAFLLGHSMGGLVAYCALDQLQHKLLGLVTLSAVYSFAGQSRILKLLAVLGHTLAVPDRLQQQPFAVRAIGKKLSQFINLSDSPWMLKLLPFQAWYPEGIERDILLQQIRIGWDISSLGVLSALIAIGRRGRFLSRDGRDLLATMPDVDLPLLVVTADDDTLLPPVDARGAYDASRSSDKTLLTFGPDHGHSRFGHLDLIIGRDAPAQVWPVLADWLDQRTTGPAPGRREHRTRE